MAGSWELRNQTSVLVSILHTDIVTMAWALGFRNLIVPGGVMPVAGMPYDHARNACCMAVLEHGIEWLFFLDSDVVPPKDAILRLIAHKKPLVCGLYFRRSPPVGVPVIMKPVGNWIINPPKKGLIEVDVTGAGCMLIHRSVLEALPPQRPGKHWFDWRVDMKSVMPPVECLSEDFTFNMHVKKTLGIPTLIDCSVRCRHIGLGEAEENSFVPANANPNT
jgi:hypothetical protein